MQIIGHVEFLAKHVWIEIFVGPDTSSAFENAFGVSSKLVLTVDDRRSRIKKTNATFRQAIQRGLEYAQGQLGSVPASVSISALLLVDHVGRVRYNQIKWTW